MRKSAIAKLTLPALVVGSLLAGAAHAQMATTPGTTSPGTTGTIVDPSVSAGTPVGGPTMTAPANGTVTGSAAGMPMPSGGIGPGMRGGVGAPIGGLDSNPYAEAPQAARALGYPYHPPGSAPRSTE